MSGFLSILHVYSEYRLVCVSQWDMVQCF